MLKSDLMMILLKNHLKNSQILSYIFADHQTVDADAKLRKMGCLPESATYGRIFQIESTVKIENENIWIKSVRDFFNLHVKNQ